MSSSLLVVDWDYFFPNPMEGGFDHDQPFLFDWGHREAPFFIDIVWQTRGVSFLANDLKLPEVEPSWKTFPERFTLSDDAVVYIADSNVHSGNLESSEGGPFDNVWLYDAHHDAGYGVKSYADWCDRHVNEGVINYSCEDWMLVHYMQGSRLHWRFPTWHESFKRRLADGKCGPECDRPGEAHGVAVPEGVQIDVDVDDLQPVDEEFDTVFICRSGAWVPSWEDRKFVEFTQSWDRDIEQLDTNNLDRGFDVRQLQEELELVKKLRKEHAR